MNPQPRHLSARAVLGGLLAAGIIGAGVAVAAEHAGSGASLSISPAAASATPAPSPSSDRHHRGPRGGEGFAGFGGLGAGELIHVLTTDTGLRPMQIMQDLAAGQTLQQIAGSNASKVRTDALAAIKTRLDALVSKQVITSAQETTLLKDAGDAIDVLMNANLSKLGIGSGKHQNGPRQSASPSPSA